MSTPRGSAPFEAVVEVFAVVEAFGATLRDFERGVGCGVESGVRARRARVGDVIGGEDTPGP
jgi:hypothetical protein